MKLNDPFFIGVIAIAFAALGFFLGSISGDMAPFCAEGEHGWSCLRGWLGAPAGLLALVAAWVAARPVWKTIQLAIIKEKYSQIDTFVKLEFVLRKIEKEAENFSIEAINFNEILSDEGRHQSASARKMFDLDIAKSEDIFIELETYAAYLFPGESIFSSITEITSNEIEYVRLEAFYRPEYYELRTPEFDNKIQNFDIIRGKIFEKVYDIMDLKRKELKKAQNKLSEKA